jgi:hypothetical protein
MFAGIEVLYLRHFAIDLFYPYGLTLMPYLYDSK